MATDDVNPDDLDALVTLLKDAAAGSPQTCRTVALDPSEVTPPGVWVRVDGFGPHTLAGVAIRTTLFLIVPDTGHKRVVGRLAALYNMIRPALPGTPAPATRAGVVLPGSTTPLPALALPFDLQTTQE